MDDTQLPKDDIGVDDEMPVEEPTTGEDEIGELKRQLEEYKSGWQRAIADYQNLCKETDAKRGELLAWSERTILEEFIPVYGNFKKAFASNNGVWTTDQENWVKGIAYIMKQFEQVLKQHGVEEIDAVGTPFDPARHEAVGEGESAEAPEGSVIKVVDSGFTMRGKVIKVAKVIISKK